MKLKRISDFSNKKTESTATNEWFSSKTSHVHHKDQWFENLYPGIARTAKEDKLMNLLKDIQNLSLEGDSLEVLANFLGALSDNKNILKPLI